MDELVKLVHRTEESKREGYGKITVQEGAYLMLADILGSAQGALQPCKPCRASGGEGRFTWRLPDNEGFIGLAGQEGTRTKVRGA